MTERIQRLQEAVETSHQCKARHAASKVIKEPLRGKIIWEGARESFDITGHPRAVRCYAWSCEQGAETHYRTVLGLSPVVSPKSAVRVAIASAGHDV
jgi:hypothetical protein